MDLFHVSNFKLSFVERGICSCSGTIRGAIAFGLSISIVSKSQLNRDILLSTTLSLVFISTIVMGALMPYFISFFKSFNKTEKEEKKEELEYVDLNDEVKDNEFRFSYLHPNFDTKIEEFSKEKDLKVLQKRLSYWLGTYWLQFDDIYLKPKLICNWPEVKKEHDEIADVITDVIKNYLEEKKKKEENINNNNINEDEEGNEMKERLFDSDKNNEYNDYKTNYMKLMDEPEESENNK
jgi:hypothetical protein